MICVTVERLTPCLIDARTGEETETVVRRIQDTSLLKNYRKDNGWYVNWDSFKKNIEIYGLFTAKDNVLQGLIALQIVAEKRAVYIVWAVAAPHNNIHNTGEKEYDGVGGHLFAIAGNRSLESGFGGFVYGFAMNREVLQHYVERLGAYQFAIEHPLQIVIDEKHMENIVEVYDYEVL